MDISKYRKDFPILNSENPPVYLDSACMTLRPKAVIDAVTDYYTNYPACGGRSVHKLSWQVTENFEMARDSIRRFMGAENQSEIIFTKNATESMNIVANGLNLGKGDQVLTSDKEHNANVVPWHHLAKYKGIKYDVLPAKDNYFFDIEALKESLSSKTKLFSFVHTSNLDGHSNPAKEIIEICHDSGVKVMMDTAQSAPHKEINVVDLDVDFAAVSAHKFCGPSGMGALYGKYDELENLIPTYVGGSTVVNSTYEDYKLLPPPSCFEAGLQNYAGAIGSGAAAEYIMNIGRDKIQAHENKLNRLMTKELENVESLNIVGPSDVNQRGGIFSFNLDGWDPTEVAMHLDEEYNIAIRSGMHCVHSWFNSRGIEGTARASVYLYNNEEDVLSFTNAIKESIKNQK
ncbi:MAG: aminotransferase class V-fold PLP-dependent enzyme [Candidatus Poseidoniales archaeon]|jgi:cysteine desulfurase/selenocysteine lyase